MLDPTSRDVVDVTTLYAVPTLTPSMIASLGDWQPRYRLPLPEWSVVDFAEDALIDEDK